MARKKEDIERSAIKQVTKAVTNMMPISIEDYISMTGKKKMTQEQINARLDDYHRKIDELKKQRDEALETYGENSKEFSEIVMKSLDTCAEFTQFLHEIRSMVRAEEV